MKTPPSILFIFMLACLSPSGLYSQEKTISPVFSFDAHRSRFLGEWVRVAGIKFGLSINKDFRYGVGFYNTSFVRLEDVITEGTTLFSKMDFQYQVFFLDYSFISTRKWDISSEFSIGSGRAQINYQEVNNVFDSSKTSPRLMIATLGGDIEYKILPYLGVSLGGGFKYLPTRHSAEDRRISKALNSFFYAAKIKLHLGEAYRTFTQ